MTFTPEQIDALARNFDGDERTLFKIMRGHAVGPRPLARFVAAAEKINLRLTRGFPAAADDRKAGVE